MKPSNVWHGHSTRPSLPAGTVRKANGHLSGARPLHLACARPFGRLKAPLGLSLLRCAAQTRACRVAGGTGPAHPQQRKTERSRRGTPCYTYRYRMWIFAGCVRQGAPCFFFVIYPMYQTAYSYGRNNSSLPCHDLTLSVGEPDNAAAQTGAGTSFGATGAPLT